MNEWIRKILSSGRWFAYIQKHILCQCANDQTTSHTEKKTLHNRTAT